MARKWYSDEGILKVLRAIELRLAEGSDVQSACRGVGVSNATYYNWRRRFGGIRSGLPVLVKTGQLTPGAVRHAKAKRTRH